VAAARAARDAGGRRGTLRCPFCTTHLFAAPLGHPAGPIRLDACDRCRILWFDRGEFDAAAGRAPPPAPHPGDAVRPEFHAWAPPVDAVPPVDVERVGSGLEGGGGLAYLLLELPVVSPESHGPPSRVVPVLAAAILAGSLAAVAGGLESSIEAFGFHPAEPLRHGGLGAFTAPFLHADLPVLAVNLAFLLMFGRPAEEILRPLPTLGLFLGAALAGWLLLAAGGGNRPVCGAGGAVSGLLAWFALELPHVRVRMFRLVWFEPHLLECSARTWGLLFAGWLVLGTLLAGYGAGDFHMHVGGALAGASLWAARNFGFFDPPVVRRVAATAPRRSPGGAP
jgi:membrane associated rhomboid family serine protease/Zn-finger nucleic acid-binding protein